MDNDENVCEKLKNEIKDSAVESLCHIITELTIRIDEHYITRKEHNKLMFELQDKKGLDRDKFLNYLRDEIKNGEKYLSDSNVDELFKIQVKFQNQYLSGLIELILKGYFD